MAFGLAAAATTASGQSLSVARFEGTVRDTRGQFIGDADVRVEGRGSSAARFTSTARDGRFRFDALPSGRYDVVVEALGYRPVRHLDVLVDAASTVRIDVSLTRVSPPVVAVDTVTRRGDPGELGTWLIERGYGDLSSQRRVGSELAAFSTTADAYGVEGLPWRYHGAMIDGTRSQGVTSPTGLGADAAGLAFPVRGLAAGAVGGLGYDVEVSGTGVGLKASTPRGGLEVASLSALEGGTANLGGLFVVSGPLQGDTAQAIFGVDHQYGEREFWGAGTQVDPRVDSRTSGFARLDWNASDRLVISARASASQYASRGLAVRDGLGSFFGTDYGATAGQAAVTVYGALTRRLAHEWRLSADVGSVRSRAPQDPRADLAAMVSGVGSAAGSPYDEFRATPRASGILHADFGAHRLKLGFSGAVHWADSRFGRDTDGLFAIGARTPTLQDGVYRRVEASTLAGEFAMREGALFLQDAWRVTDGLTLTVGVRADAVRIPASNIGANVDWQDVSALDNTAVRARRSHVSPRASVRWELGRDRAWVIEGGAGTYRDLPDLRDVSEALSFDTGADVRLAVGSFAIDRRPTAAEAGLVGQTLTMLAPSFEGPRTQRITLGVTRRLAGWSATVNAVYRQTDLLTRRRDLNLPAAPVGADQYGRPLYGQLQQYGRALVALPQSNRRFAGFDAAHVLESSGLSEFWGLTVGVERVRDLGLSVAAQYTLSQTTDNVASFAGSRLMPFPQLQGTSDWTVGRSDLDVPHRALVAFDWRTSSRLSFGVIAHARSGLPYTAGVRTGVDANGDGDWDNDPASVDGALAGMDALLDEHSCLRGDRGGFATRNACREPFVVSVDARVSMRLGRLSIGTVHAVVEAIDLLGPSAAPVDRALLLVDDTGAISQDPATGATIVPYVTNPGFGARAAARAVPVLWRVGLRVTP